MYKKILFGSLCCVVNFSLLVSMELVSSVEERKTSFFDLTGDSIQSIAQNLEPIDAYYLSVTSQYINKAMQNYEKSLFLVINGVGITPLFMDSIKDNPDYVCSVTYEELNKLTYENVESVSKSWPFGEDSFKKMITKKVEHIRKNSNEPGCFLVISKPKMSTFNGDSLIKCFDFACDSGNVTVLNIVLKSNYLKQEYVNKKFIYYCYYNNIAFVKALLGYSGLDINRNNGEGLTALDLISDISLMELLKQYGARTGESMGFDQDEHV